MFDLQVLAFQTDLTRVITFMLGRELSGRSYPEVDVYDAHHPTSHHQGDPDKLRKLARINQYHLSQFAYFLDRLTRSRWRASTEARRWWNGSWPPGQIRTHPHMFRRS